MKTTSSLSGTMQPVIRMAVAADGDTVRTMVFHILQEYDVPADPEGSDADVMEFGRPARPEVLHFVAEINGRVVGSAILTPQLHNKIKVSKLFVHQNYRGFGLGRKLLRRAIAEARDRGYDEVFLTTRALYREAVSLYEAEKWLRGADQPPPGPDRLYYLPLMSDTHDAHLRR